jgi:hypothetical protein
MKAINTIKFLMNARDEFTGILAGIASAEDFEAAKSKEAMAVGFCNCMIVFGNTMICEENNGFTGDLDEALDEWMAGLYQCMADKAKTTGQPDTVMFQYLNQRDSYLRESE